MSGILESPEGPGSIRRAECRLWVEPARSEQEREGLEFGAEETMQAQTALTVSHR